MPAPHQALPLRQPRARRHSIPFHLLGGAAVWLTSLAAAAQSQPQPQSHFWLLDGPVGAIVITNDTVYLGGTFSYVGPRTSSAALFESSSLARIPAFPGTPGVIYAAVPDGQGGWFLGGQFTSLGGCAITNLAHIDSRQALDPAWNARMIGTAVRALALHDDRLLVGGQFTRFDGVGRKGLAAVRTADASLDDWNPDIPGTVYALAVADDTLFVGGSFSVIGGVARENLAAFQLVSNTITAWKPQPDNTVLAIAPAGNTVYIGGSFTTAGAKPRNRLAALDTTTGQATTWNPNPNGTVRALATTGDAVFAGGDFTTISVRNRRGFAALSRTDGSALALDFAIEGSGTPANLVEAVRIVGNTVWIGGSFRRAQAANRPLVAAADLTTGEPAPVPLGTLFNGAADNALVYALATDPTRLLCVGSFESLGGVPRTNAAALSSSGGQVLDWDPAPAEAVQALAYTGDRVLIAGALTRVRDTAVKGLAAVDPVTGLPLSSWAFTASNHLGAPLIRTLLVAGDRVYVGGQFDAVGGVATRMLAALDPATGNRRDFNAAVKGGTAGVSALALANDLLFVAGDYTGIGNQTRARLAAVAVGTGLANAWNPAPNQEITALAATSDHLYVGGSFTRIGGMTLRNLAAFQLSDLSLLPWDASLPNTANGIEALAALETAVYVSGNFTSIGGEFRDRVAQLMPSTGQAGDWSPGPSAIPAVIALSENFVALGGSFRGVANSGAQPQAYFAAYGRGPWITQTQLAAGKLTLQATTGDRPRAVLQCSPDLIAWENCQTNEHTGFRWTLEQPVDTAPYRFFRVVAP